MVHLLATKMEEKRLQIVNFYWAISDSNQTAEHNKSASTGNEICETKALHDAAFFELPLF